MKDAAFSKFYLNKGDFSLNPGFYILENILDFMFSIVSFCLNFA